MRWETQLTTDDRGEVSFEFSSTYFTPPSIHTHIDNSSWCTACWTELNVTIIANCCRYTSLNEISGSTCLISMHGIGIQWNLNAPLVWISKIMGCNFNFAHMIIIKHWAVNTRNFSISFRAVKMPSDLILMVYFNGSKFMCHGAAMAHSCCYIVTSQVKI